MPAWHIDHLQAPIVHWHGEKSTYSERSVSWTALGIITVCREGLPDVSLSHHVRIFP